MELDLLRENEKSEYAFKLRIFSSKIIDGSSRIVTEADREDRVECNDSPLTMSHCNVISMVFVTWLNIIQ